MTLRDSIATGTSHDYICVHVCYECFFHIFNLYFLSRGFDFSGMVEQGLIYNPS